MLLVTPYYNKATQKGLIESFKAIADASTKPCILYNVPSRTGCNLQPASVAILADHPNIVGIKEACGDISQVAELCALVGDKIAVYSGNDDQIVPILSLGGKGVISVLSNIMPRATQKMCEDYMSGNTEAARKAQLSLLPTYVLRVLIHAGLLPAHVPLSPALFHHPQAPFRRRQFPVWRPLSLEWRLLSYPPPR